MPKLPANEHARSAAEENTLTEEAAAWFLRMQQSDGNDAEQKAFEAWLSHSEAHRAEYQQYVRLWHNLDHLERKQQKPSRTTVVSMLVLTLIFGALLWISRIEEVIVTAIGEHRQINLADETVIDINTGTKLRLSLYGLTRKVTIEHGEALFKIGNERLRAFEVHAGSGVIRDIGTEFNVTQENDKTTVAVLEGAVEISLNGQVKAPRTVHDGQLASYTQREISDISAADTESITAWRKNRLIFHDTPLNEVVRQINRYHNRPVLLTEPRLNTLRVSGEFNATDRDGLIRALKSLFMLNSQELDNETLLYSER